MILELVVGNVYVNNLEKDNARLREENETLKAARSVYRPRIGAIEVIQDPNRGQPEDYIGYF